MTLTLKEWQEGLDTWKRVKKDAEITLEQTDLYISVIEQKIKEMEMENNGE